MRIEPTRFIAATALGLLAWSLAADAQQPTKVPRIGILSDESRLLATKSFEPFAQGLRDLGYVEGQNIAFERRYADGNNEILSNLAAELVHLQPDVILAISTPAVRAAKTATQTIPIVFARISDPVGLGIVPTLARPGGNVTGVSVLGRELEGKRLELLITAVPDTKRLGVLWDPSFPPAEAELKEIEAAARVLNLEPISTGARSRDDFEPALRTIVERGASVLIVVPGTIFTEHSREIAEMAVKARLPTVFQRREFAEAGGLMSYGPSYPDMYRRAAAYVDKILKGARPADIPVEQPTKFELVINLKTAKSLGLTIPQTFLLRADEVIE